MLYPLVNCYIAMENHIFYGYINYFDGHFQVRKLYVYQKVCGNENHFLSGMTTWEHHEGSQLTDIGFHTLGVPQNAWLPSGKLSVCY